jgi:hypothetical protein
MQIREITQLNENAASAFASGFSQATGVNMPKIGTDVPATPYKYGPAGQQQAAKMSEPAIQLQAEKEMANWNASILNLLKQNGVSSPAQLDRATKQSLATTLVNQLHKNFMQQRLGSDYKSLPRLIDVKKQPEAQAAVKDIQVALNSILNFNTPAQDKQTQLAQWLALSRAAYNAMSLVQFHPSKSTMAQTRVPELKQNPDGTYSIGGQKLNPADPTDAKIIQKIQAQRVPGAGAAPTAGTTT